MIEAWLSATPSILVATFALIAPGLVVIFAGWGGRSPRSLLLAPAVSAAILAVAAILAPMAGIAWSWLPVGLVTAIAGGVAYGVRRWAGPENASPVSRSALFAMVAGLMLAATALALQMMFVFIGPAHISQTFDAIVHLNTVRYAVETANASAFSIGATSDIPFYPNTWHSLASLTALTTGVSVPVAVNAANIAIAAIAWPASAMALGASIFQNRASALLATAALSTAFGAFPILLFDFGVLYPNAMGYAVLPAGIAVVWQLLQTRSTPQMVREAILLLVISVGIGLGHPNAFLALVAFGTFLTVWHLVASAGARGTRRAWIINLSIVIGVLAAAGVLWRLARTNWEMSRWGPWQSTAQATGEALLLSPRGYPITLVSAVLLAIGIIAIIRRPRDLPVLLPAAVAGFMFILVSGTPVDTLLREMVTNPWYNDSYRLAALLPIAGIPVAVYGVTTIVDAAKQLIATHRISRVVTVASAGLGIVTLFLVALGPNVTEMAKHARQNYTMNDTSALLTDSEAALIERLPESVPDDALIAGSPWTGVSLAYAITGADVMELHVFGARDDDEIYLDANLSAIESDPLVCEAVRRLGVDYVIDFGDRNVFSNPDAGTERAGVENLQASAHLVLVDEEGPDARLFRIEGC